MWKIQLHPDNVERKQRVLYTFWIFYVYALAGVYIVPHIGFTLLYSSPCMVAYLSTPLS